MMCRRRVPTLALKTFRHFSKEVTPHDNGHTQPAFCNVQMKQCRRECSNTKEWLVFIFAHH